MLYRLFAERAVYRRYRYILSQYFVLNFVSRFFRDSTRDYRSLHVFFRVAGSLYRGKVVRVLQINARGIVR